MQKQRTEQILLGSCDIPLVFVFMCNYFEIYFVSIPVNILSLTGLKLLKSISQFSRLTRYRFFLPQLRCIYFDAFKLVVVQFPIFS